jgi:hypothetical protein
MRRMHLIIRAPADYSSNRSKSPGANLPLLEMSCDNWWTVKSTPLTAGVTAKPSSKRLSWKQPLDRRLPCCNWASTEGIPGMWE